MRVGVQGLGFGTWGEGGVQGLGFGSWGEGWGSGFRV